MSWKRFGLTAVVVGLKVGGVVSSIFALPIALLVPNLVSLQRWSCVIIAILGALMWWAGEVLDRRHLLVNYREGEFSYGGCAVGCLIAPLIWTTMPLLVDCTGEWLEWLMGHFGG